MNEPSQAATYTAGLVLPEYIRRRREPEPGDRHYLHIADLLAFIKTVEPLELKRVLDYGCGGSPYRSLLRSTDYKRADFPGDKTLDYVLNESMAVPEPDGSFDSVLSTQVLEHVAAPDSYLSEARRLIRPDGYLILTTHGTFMDHGCPHDYQRWTADGLAKLVSDNGFQLERMCKLTTGPRAAFFVNEDYWEHLWDSRKTFLGWALWFFRKAFWGNAARRDRWIDERCSAHSLVPHDEPGHELYIALGLVARRR